MIELINDINKYHARFLQEKGFSAEKIIGFVL